MDSYITKPITWDRLLKVLYTTVNRAAARRDVSAG